MSKREIISGVVSGVCFAAGIIIFSYNEQMGGFENNVNNLLKNGCTLLDNEGKRVNEVLVRKHKIIFK